MHHFFHNRTVISPQPILITHIHISLVSVLEVNFVLFNSMLKYVIKPSGRSLGMITVLIWKKACINLYIFATIYRYVTEILLKWRQNVNPITLTLTRIWIKFTTIQSFCEA
jgi:hypothetical protein